MKRGDLNWLLAYKRAMATGLLLTGKKRARNGNLKDKTPLTANAQGNASDTEFAGEAAFGTGQNHLFNVVGAAFIRNNEVLVCQRSSEQSMAGKWEFPGGKVEAGEDNRTALAREIKEELGIQVQVKELIGEGYSTKGNVTIHLSVYRCEGPVESIVLKQHQQMKWVPFGELDKLDFTPADISICETLKKRAE